MKTILLLIVVCIGINFGFNNPVYCQKRPIKDTTVFSWPRIENPQLSPNGRYAFYYVANQQSDVLTAVFQSTSSGWKMEINCPRRSYKIDIGDETAVLQISDTTAAIISLGKGCQYISGYSSITMDIESSVITAHNINSGKLLIIHNGKTDLLNDILQHSFMNRGSSLFLLSKTGTSDSENVSVFDFRAKKFTVFWRGKSARSIIFNRSKTKCAFLSSELRDKVLIDVINYLSVDSEFKAIALEDEKLKVESLECFNGDDQVVFYNLIDTVGRHYKSSPIGLKVWTWKDQKPMNEQIKDISINGCTAAINVKSGSRHIFKTDKNKMMFSRFNNGLPANDLRSVRRHCVVAENDGNCYINEFDWNPACQIRYFIIDILDASRKEINFGIDTKHVEELTVSLDEKFVIYYSVVERAYFSYRISDAKKTRLSGRIFESAKSSSSNNQLISYVNSNRGILGWYEKEGYLLVGDQYDIWLIDPRGQIDPANLTKGYGYESKIQFSLLQPNMLIRSGYTLFVSAFNMLTKENGFYAINAATKAKPNKLIMGPYIFYLDRGQAGSGGISPIEATRARKFLLQRESSKSSPNLYFTDDFSNFKQLTSIHPETEFEWYSTELHTYNHPNGTLLQGVLFKPYNFDSTKKYPIIFNIYELLSNSLNTYIPPSSLCKGCIINPHTYTSNGYLVFKPDIVYKYDSTGPYSLMSVVAALDHLGKFTWADTSLAGIQGCSFGGFQINYIVSHSNKFKAACSASGVSDPLTQAAGRTVEQSLFKVHAQNRLVSKPWTDPKIYFENSAVFNANKIQTPLLLFNTPEDGAVPFSEGLQLYSILRQLSKPVWLLEYNGFGANHGVFDAKQQNDFGLRMLQFFNHYLKKESPPEWLFEGIPATSAGINDGLKLIK